MSKIAGGLSSGWRADCQVRLDGKIAGSLAVCIIICPLSCLQLNGEISLQTSRLPAGKLACPLAFPPVRQAKHKKEQKEDCLTYNVVVK